jgi:iron complex outermembrane receptor protein
MFRKSYLAASILITHSVAYAGHLPEVTVEESPWQIESHSVSGIEVTHADTASALKSLPGAAVNRNGGLTGIAQYRGLYGDRIAVNIDSATLVTGGPNSMDTPLSYIPASLLKVINIEQGVASVSKAQESLGGMINAQSDTGAFSETDAIEFSGRAHANFNQQNSSNSSSLLLTAADNTHKVSVASSYDDANDSEFADGDINSSGYKRRHHDITYGYQHDDTKFNLKLSKNNTGKSGTAALPMDITAIDSDLASFDIETKISDVAIHWKSSYSHVFHVMNNFTLRPEPMMGKRETLANGQKVSHQLMTGFNLPYGSLQAGADVSKSQHSANVYNPDMPAFLVENFNNVEKNIAGYFAQWQHNSHDFSWELGARANHITMDSDTVSSTMMGMLATAFNNEDRSRTFNNRDLVLKTNYRLNDKINVTFNVSSKERAPSYQAMYLWMPMQSTGGLADGKTYIGNRELNSETANEVNLGFSLKTDDYFLALHSFYKKVDDYIQGTPANAGMADLKYNNIDAKLYGGEISYGARLTDTLSLAGNLNYVRGKSTDTGDNLYRIAPLNNRLSLDYTISLWNLSLVSEIFDHQNKVSNYNEEAKTSGYSLWHINAVYNPNTKTQIRMGIDNLTDKVYQDHLAGYNRVTDNSDIATGERLYGTGRSVNLGITYQF